MEKVQDYEQLINEKKILKGKVRTITTIKYNDRDVRAIGINSKELGKTMIYIPIMELALQKSRVFLKPLLNSEIEFRLKSVDNDTIIAERVSIINDKRIEFLKEVNEKPEASYKAVIKKILEHGAYLSIGEVDVFMYNSAFADGHIPISVVKKEGDIVEVVFNKFNPKIGRIYVKMKDRYTEDKTLEPTDIKPQDIMRGTIRTKTMTLCFVNVAPMIDVLCSPVAGLEVGDEVDVKIVGYKEKEDGSQMVRGKILVSRRDDDFRL